MSDKGGFPPGGGETGALMRAHDWSASPLGDPALWPQPLRLVTGLLLASRFPMFVAWGPGLGFLYNDAYAEILGDKHPAALGARFADIWSEIWPGISPLVEAALSGQSSYHEDLPFLVNRRGAPEQAWFTFSYSPVRDEDGRVAGMFSAVTETTGRILTEQRLHQSQERLEFALAAGGGVGAWDWDLKADRIYADARFARLYSVDPARAAAGAPIAEYLAAIHPEDRDKTTEAISRSIAAGGDIEIDYRLLLPDGSLRWVLARGRTYRDADGTPARMPGVVIDITERKATELALRASEARLRELNADLERQVAERALSRGRIWQVSPDLLAVAGADGFLSSVNPAWERTLGWTEAEILAQPFLELVHPDDVASTLAVYGTLKAGTPLLRFENRYRHKGGGFRWLSWVAVPEGERIYCTARDVSAEKAQAAELAERTAERDRIWRLSIDLMAVVTLDGTLKRANPAWTTVLGLAPEEVEGRSMIDLKHPDDRAKGAAALARLVGGATITDFEDRFRHADGSYRHISWTASAPEGGLIFAIGRDVSDEKLRQEELAQAQEALRQSQKMEAVGQLTGGLAHDFNNLLAGISGSLELTQSRITQGRAVEAERYIAAAQGATRRAAALTHRLLAFTRRQTLAPRPTDVNRLVAGMEELVRRTVGPAVEVEITGAPGVHTLLVDRHQFENALLNLCINARDAMPDGGRLRIQTTNHDFDAREAREQDLPPGRYVSLCVHDTGHGMTPEVAARAFDPFFTTKPIGEGTGLGLSMVYGFVRQSGGQIRIDSEPGQGTLLCLYFPSHPGEAEPEDAPPAPAEPPRAEQGETVLVVDDEPAIRMLVSEVLQDLGYAAIEAADAAAGLQALRSDTRIDLLVTDVGLPGSMNGRQMADTARELRPGLKVLFITGYAQNAVLSHGRLDPGMHVLTKPFAMDVLASRIRTLIG